MSIQPTIFGGDTGMTYEDLQRKRAMADQLIAGQQRAPRNVGEGLTAIGNALAARGLRKQAEKRDKELRGEFNDQWSSLFNGGVPGGMSDVLPQGGMGASSYTPAKPNTPEYPVGDAGPSPRETAGDYTMGKTVAGHDHAVHAGQDHSDWLKYANQGATRNQPLSEDLVGALSFLPDLGVEMRVVSGGQAAKGTGGARTGSTRHDHGNAADVDFYKDGRKLDWNNPQDVPLFQEIVRQASARGVTGFGAGDDYMGAGRMHIGFGDKAVWGAGGKGANAPDWLRSASQGGGQMGGSFQPGQGTQTAQAGGMNMQTLAEIASSPYASAGQKFMAQQLLQQRMQAMDPNTQLDYQIKLQQLANATREPDRTVIKGADGYSYYQDTGERVLPGVNQPGEAPLTKNVTMQDGSEVMVQWNAETQQWDAAKIPEGGTTGSGGSTDLTEGQSKLTLFQTLQDETQPVLKSLESQFDPANLSDPAKARIPIAGNYFASPEYQMYTTAAAAWAEGALRIATGAAATQPEIERNIKTYFAQPGDTPQTVAFKTQMRDMYSRAVNNALGKAPSSQSLPIPKPQDFADQVQEPGGQGGTTPAPDGTQTKIPPAPKGVDGITPENWPDVYDSMSPEDRSLFQ